MCHRYSQIPSYEGWGGTVASRTAKSAVSLIGVVLFALLCLSSPLAAQRREPDPHDVEAGSSRYMNICVSCHGQDGDQVSGVDLGHDTFRHATSDQELVQIIINGIPGTGMPANKMSENAASAIVTYLHSIAKDHSQNNAKGDPVKGAALFASQGCSGCHRIRSEGARIGPDLTDIGKYRRSAELERAILDPAADIAPDNRFVKIVTADGTQIEGRLLNHDTFTVLLMDRNERLRSFDRTTIREMTIEDKRSSMPSYRGKLADQQLADIVAYLGQQKGIALK